MRSIDLIDSDINELGLGMFLSTTSVPQKQLYQSLLKKVKNSLAPVMGHVTDENGTKIIVVTKRDAGKG